MKKPLSWSGVRSVLRAALLIGLVGLGLGTARAQHITIVEIRAFNTTFQTNQVNFANAFVPPAGAQWAPSTAKSKAPGYTTNALAESSSSYASSIPAATTNAGFTIVPKLPVAGGAYSVDVTHTSSSCSTAIIVSNSVTGGSGLPGTTDGFQASRGVDAWYNIGTLRLDPGVTNPAITFRWFSGEINSGLLRFYADAFRFTLLSAPTLTAQPAHRTVNVGQSSVFSVTATTGNGGTLRYQWQFNGTNIANATSTAYTLANAQLTNAGNYSVIVTNNGGLVTSTNAFLTVIDPPPVFTTQPFNRTVNAGTNVIFGASVSSSTPTTYQWKWGGTNIAGASGSGTSTALNLPNVQAYNTNALYSVSFTNSGGTTNSTNALLSIIEIAPIITQQPVASQTVGSGTPASFSVTANGTTPFFYQWYFSDNPVPSATGSAFSRSPAQVADTGNYYVVVSNSVGTTTSSPLSSLTVTNNAPSFTLQPVSQTVNAGGNATFTASAIGASPRFYQWTWGGTNINGATDTSYTLNNVQDINTNALYAVVVSNAFGVVTSTNATIVLLPTPPTISQNPTNRTAGTGTATSFFVTATGTQPFFYQWHFNNSPIGSATGSTFTRNPVQLSHDGPYFVVVSNQAGQATSAVATLTVTNSGPVITGPPQSTNVIAGTNATFTVTATGGGTLFYQWRLGGTAIPQATNSAYTVFNVQVSTNYSVIVSNFDGVTPSGDAFLTVLQTNPIITVQPVASQVINATSNVFFSVTTIGSDPRSYQWRKNGTPIGGATGTQHSFTVNFGDGGDYTVVITNRYGAVTSSISALVVVPPPPVITVPPANATVPAGSNVTLSVTASSFEPPAYLWQRAPTNTPAVFTNVPGVTVSAYAFPNAQPVMTGVYRAIVSNSGGSVTSAPATLVITNSRPIITLDLITPRTLNAGEVGVFTVSTIGSDVRTYFWSSNSVLIAGATNATFTIPNVQAGHAGAYQVIISNAFGRATSKLSQLFVLDSPPIITAQPVSRKVSAGSCVTFAPGVIGTQPIAYQWKFNNQPIPGAYDPSLTIYEVQTNQTGTFSLSISNAQGVATTTTVNLEVMPGPVLDTFFRTSSNTVVLGWTTIPNRTYKLQYKNDLGDATWTDLGGPVNIPDCSTVMTDTNAPAAQKRFYRLMLLP